MNKYLTTKFLRRTILSTPLKAIDFNGSQKNAKLGLDVTTTVFSFMSHQKGITTSRCLRKQQQQQLQAKSN